MIIIASVVIGIILHVALKLIGVNLPWEHGAIISTIVIIGLVEYSNHKDGSWLYK